MEDPTLVVELASESATATELKQALEEHLSATDGELELELRNDPTPFRLDPVTLFVVIKGGATAVSALIGLYVAMKKAKGTIRIESKDGSRINLPGDASPERIAEVVRALENRPPRKITLLEP